MKKRIGQIALAVLMVVLFAGHVMKNAYFVTILLPNEYNPKAPLVDTACRPDGTTQLTYAEQADKSWVKVQKVGSSNYSATSSSSNIGTSHTEYPMDPGLYTVVTRQWEDFDKDPMPDAGFVLSYLFVVVPNCSK